MNPRKAMIRHGGRGFIAYLADIPYQPSEQIEGADLRSLAGRLFAAGFRLGTVEFPPFDLSDTEIAEMRQEMFIRTAAWIEAGGDEPMPDGAALKEMEACRKWRPQIAQLKTQGRSFDRIALLMRQCGLVGRGLTGEALQSIFRQLNLEETEFEMEAADETLRRKLAALDDTGGCAPWIGR